jgi:hypothetical protein
LQPIVAVLSKLSYAATLQNSRCFEQNLSCLFAKSANYVCSS